MIPEGVEYDPTRRRVNRRDLFRSHARDGGAMPNAPTSVATTPGSRAILNASRPGMGSFFEVRIGAEVPGAVDLASRALDRIDELEAQLTVYNDESEVSRLNASAHRGPVAVERGLFDLLEHAVAIGRLTRGAYDVTAGALSLAWGFTRGPKRVPDAEALADARERTGSNLLILDLEKKTVAFDRSGVVINLGSIGKGYAIDRAADVIRGHWWPTTALIHGGRSSVYALGSPPDDFGGRWAVAVRDPADPEHPLGTVYLRNRGMGTSGAAFQKFAADGREYGHIIDPRTGEPPADGPSSVTVLAPTAAEADALSTAFYLLGPAATATILAGRPDVGALFVTRATPDAPSRFQAIGLTDADFTPTRTGRRPEAGPTRP